MKKNIRGESNDSSRVSHMSCSSKFKDERYDMYLDIAQDGPICISPKSVHELILESTILHGNDKMAIQNLLWLVFTKKMDENIARNCILNIVQSDKTVFDRFNDYLEQCDFFNVA